MVKVGVRNPLFLLDEIDKMGMDHRGDPASAMLEVLDPEQNHAFNDHYLEVDYDLSDVMFVCTSNTMNIPGPLLDRMEVIRIPGYTEDEKVSIARKYLLPKQVKVNGLKPAEISVADEAILDIVRYYTREAGVRAMERELAKVCRKVVKKLALEDWEVGTEVTSANLAELLGVRKFTFGVADEANQVGEVTGLAWTSVGGELLTIEAASVSGKGRHVRTGSLGDVMQESIQAAMTVVRSRSQGLGIPRYSRPTYSRARRRYAKGWAQRRYRDVHRAGERGHEYTGTRGCCHDRGNHPAGRGLGDWWSKREITCSQAWRNKDSSNST
jgi:ATP-dependent Lon protease